MYHLKTAYWKELITVMCWKSLPLWIRKLQGWSTMLPQQPSPQHSTELLGIIRNSKCHKNTVKWTAIKNYINAEQPDILVICEGNLMVQESKSWSKYTLSSLDHPMILYNNPNKTTSESVVILALSNCWITRTTVGTEFLRIKLSD